MHRNSAMLQIGDSFPSVLWGVKSAHSSPNTLSKPFLSNMRFPKPSRQIRFVDWYMLIIPALDTCPPPHEKPILHARRIPRKKTQGKRDFSPHSSRYTPLLSSEGVNNAVRSGKGACRRRLNKNGRFCIQFLGEINVGIYFSTFAGIRQCWFSFWSVNNSENGCSLSIAVDPF